MVGFVGPFLLIVMHMLQKRFEPSVGRRRDSSRRSTEGKVLMKMTNVLKSVLETTWALGANIVAGVLSARGHETI